MKSSSENRSVYSENRRDKEGSDRNERDIERYQEDKSGHRYNDDSYHESRRSNGRNRSRSPEYYRSNSRDRKRSRSPEWNRSDSKTRSRIRDSHCYSDRDNREEEKLQSSTNRESSRENTKYNNDNDDNHSSSNSDKSTKKKKKHKKRKSRDHSPTDSEPDRAKSFDKNKSSSNKAENVDTLISQSADTDAEQNIKSGDAKLHTPQNSASSCDKALDWRYCRTPSDCGGSSPD